MRKIILAIVIALMAATAVAADTIYLRDGRAVRGTVLGFINGRFAIRVNSNNNAQGTYAGSSQQANSSGGGDIQFFRPRDIDRVEIDGRSLEEARFLTRNVEVALGPNWIDSGVDVRRGQRVRVNASGTIVAGRTRITPSGLRSIDPSAPLPRAAEGVLIGAISNDPNAPIIEIGLSREFEADRDGRLYLTVNRSTYTDARGSFAAQIRTELNFNAGRDTNAANSNRNDADRDDQYDPFGSNSGTTPAPVRPRVGGNTNQSNGGFGDANTNRTPREVTISVPGNSRGTDTGIDLRSGDRVTVTATGSITAGRRAGMVSADGGRVGFGSVIGTYPVPNAGVGALIGYLQTTAGQQSAPFLVGSQQTITAQADGRLILLINDDNVGDNSGNFSVRIVY
ncbi:MAG: LecA/PA-IL family lectin [Pyrinomonadaceae bacterium]